MAKLEIDLPLFKRCCFCVPLRYGLFIFGCLKLILVVKDFSIEIYNFTTSPMPWLCVLEVVFNVLLMAAAIMRREKLYHIYYKCAIFECMVIMIIFFLVQIKFWQSWSRSGLPSNPREDAVEWLLFLVFDGVMILSFLLQVYITLLVRSALVKLREATPNTDNTVEEESQSPVGKSVEV